ncbi:MAG: UvrD-helicase domain-containing protein [Candidatus Sungbacteria bacterium]|nr:UvrD-helicase domain-containing protein [Candidatus Sungbacteria bacterium]
MPNKQPGGPLLDNLNPKQREAVEATEGPVLILAGPGSGKTKVLTHRIAYLIQNGIMPENILAVTFTNKAAGEMTARIKNILAKNLDLRTENLAHKNELLSSNTLSSKFLNGSSLPFIGTFHSFALRILRHYPAKLGYFPNFTVCDEDDSLSILREVMKDAGINPKQFSAPVLLNTISGLKSELIHPEEYASREDITELFPKTVHKTYIAYQKRLHDSNSMDFDDLLMQCCRLFVEQPGILEAYQERFRYIHVDEWQDTNRAQYVLITELAKKYKNIAVVGDDAQSIYMWRNADYRNIMNFEKDWPGLKTVILDQNYRSTQTILDAARGVISRNLMQKKKNLWTERRGGEKLKIIAVEHEHAEAEFIGERIEDLLKTGLPHEEIAVLYRTNAQSRAIEEEMLLRKIPYKITGGIRFYQRREIKDVIAYLRYILNERDLLSLKRVLNVPPRGIGKSALLFYLTNSGQKTGGLAPLEHFHALIEKLRKEARERPAILFLKSLLSSIHYKEYLQESALNMEERWENIKEFLNIAAKYEEETPPAGIEKLLEDITLISDKEELAGANTHGVNLMTLHAAKGLEFSVVFIAGCEDGILPHSRTLFNPTDLEEERRLCYVGITRAKDEVFLIYALERTQFGQTQINPPSRFLSEIPEHLMEIEGEDIINI